MVLQLNIIRFGVCSLSSIFVSSSYWRAALSSHVTEMYDVNWNEKQVWYPVSNGNKWSRFDFLTCSAGQGLSFHPRCHKGVGHHSPLHHCRRAGGKWRARAAPLSTVLQNLSSPWVGGPRRPTQAQGSSSVCWVSVVIHEYTNCNIIFQWKLYTVCYEIILCKLFNLHISISHFRYLCVPARVHIYISEVYYII